MFGAVSLFSAFEGVKSQVMLPPYNNYLSGAAIRCPKEQHFATGGVSWPNAFFSLAFFAQFIGLNAAGIALVFLLGLGVILLGCGVLSWFLFFCFRFV